jgi:hypothetical protein
MKKARNMLARWLRGPQVTFPRCPYCGRTQPDTPVYACTECRGRFCEPCTHEWEDRRLCPRCNPWRRTVTRIGVIDGKVMAHMPGYRLAKRIVR